LESVDAWLLMQPSLVNGRKRALLPVVRERQGLADSLTRYLAQLGLERRAVPIPSLDDYLRQRHPPSEELTDPSPPAPAGPRGAVPGRAARGGGGPGGRGGPGGAGGVNTPGRGTRRGTGASDSSQQRGTPAPGRAPPSAFGCSRRAPSDTRGAVMPTGAAETVRPVRPGQRDRRGRDVTILAALDDPHLLGAAFREAGSWTRWRVALAGLFGLPMTAEAAAVFGEHTGRTSPPREPAREAWFMVGRRGGKSRMAAAVAVYLACFRDYRAV